MDFQYPQTDRSQGSIGPCVEAFDPVIFQYPQTDRSQGSISPASSVPRHQATFSILKRIEAKEALRELETQKSLPTFQYPQTDRSQGSRGGKRLSGDPHLLSVSSNGSKPRKPCGHVGAVVHRLLSVSSNGSKPRKLVSFASQRIGALPFSILKRIEAKEAAAAGDIPGALNNFQYPQTDRSQGSTTPCPNRSTAAFTFQYPQTDRSQGSSKAPVVGSSVPATFSILKRIEAKEAADLPTLAPCLSAFQYPQTDRSQGSATLAALVRAFARLSVSSNGSKPRKPNAIRASAHRLSTFSILKRIEAKEALACEPLRPLDAVPFSILKRIEAKEAHNGDYRLSVLEPFSILKRIEAKEAYLAPPLSSITRWLSVSSNGSKPRKQLETVTALA